MRNLQVIRWALVGWLLFVPCRFGPCREPRLLLLVARRSADEVVDLPEYESEERNKEHESSTSIKAERSNNFALAGL